MFKISSGGGGVGKSFLIRCLSKWIEKILRKAGDHPLHPKVLKLGPTGMAALLIGMLLLHMINIYCKTHAFFQMEQHCTQD